MDDDQALLLQVSADVSRLEKQMARAVGIVHSSSTAMEARADTLSVNLGKSLDRAFDESRLTVLRQGGLNLRFFGSALEPLGALGIGAAAGLIALGAAVAQSLKTAEWAAGLEHASKALGLTTTQLQLFDFQATAIGIPVDKMRESMGGLEKTIGLVMSGLARSTTVKAFTNELKITPEQLRGWGDLEHQLPHVLEAVSHLDAETRAGVASRLKIDPDVLTSLVDARGKLGDLSAEAQSYGIIMDAGVVKKTAEAAEKMHVAAAVIDGELRVAFADLAPLVANAATDFARMTHNLVDFIGQAGDAIEPIQRLINKLAELPSIKAAAQGSVGSLFGLPGQVLFNTALAGFGAAAQQGRNDKLHDAVLAMDAGGKPSAQFMEDYAAAHPAPATPPGVLPKAPRAKRGPKDNSSELIGSVDSTLDQAVKAYAEAMASLTTDILAHADFEKQVVADELKKKGDAIDAEERKIATDKGITAARKQQLTATLEAARGDDVLAAAAKDELIDRKKEAALRQQAFDHLGAQISANVEILRADDAIAVGSKAHRDLQLKILNAEEQQAEAALEKQIADAKSAGEAKKALDLEIQLNAMRASFGARQQAVVNATASPGEAYVKRLQDQLGPGFGDELQNVAVHGLESLNTGLTDAIVNAKSLGAAFGDMARTIETDLINLLIEKYLTLPIAQALGLAGGGGGFLGGVFGSIFGGGSSSLAAFSAVPFASGTDSAPGGLSLVGENGPELLNVPRGSQVIPNSTLAAMGNITPGMALAVHTSNITFELHSPVVTQDLIEQMQAIGRQATTHGATIALQAARSLIPQEMARRQSLAIR